MKMICLVCELWLVEAEMNEGEFAYFCERCFYADRIEGQSVAPHPSDCSSQFNLGKHSEYQLNYPNPMGVEIFLAQLGRSSASS